MGYDSHTTVRDAHIAVEAELSDNQREAIRYRVENLLRQLSTTELQRKEPTIPQDVVLNGEPGERNPRLILFDPEEVTLS